MSRFIFLYSANLYFSLTFLSISFLQHQPLCAGDVADHIYDGDEWTGPAVNYTETWTSQKD